MIKAFFGVAVYLIERFTNRHAAFFELDLNQRQPVHQDRHVIAVGVAAGLGELIDHLQVVAGDVLLIDKVDILDVPIIKHKIADMIVMDFARFLDHVFRRPIKILKHEARPFAI